MQDSLLDSTVTLCDFDDAFTPYLAVFVQNKHGEREQCTQRNMQGTVYMASVTALDYRYGHNLYKGGQECAETPPSVDVNDAYLTCAIGDATQTRLRCTVKHGNRRIVCYRKIVQYKDEFQKVTAHLRKYRHLQVQFC